MRCRHFLNPVLSPLSFAKPPSRPLACRARAATQPPPAQRRVALAEPDVGISRFASSLPGFRAALKQRYSDFVVHEVARDGALVRLTSFDLPDEVPLLSTLLFCTPIAVVRIQEPRSANLSFRIGGAVRGFAGCRCGGGGG
jgi:hypothetical protein